MVHEDQMLTETEQRYTERRTEREKCVQAIRAGHISAGRYTGPSTGSVEAPGDQRARGGDYVIHTSRHRDRKSVV